MSTAVLLSGAWTAPCFDKADVIQRGNAAGLPLELTLSCLKPGVWLVASRGIAGVQQMPRAS